MTHNPFHTQSVLAEVAAERARQDGKWGVQNHDPATWLMILGEEVGEANQAAVEHYFSQFQKDAASRGPRSLEEYRTELVQVAAVATAMVESLDRNELAGRGIVTSNAMLEGATS